MKYIFFQIMSLSKLKNVIEKNISSTDSALKELKLHQKSLTDNAEKLKLNIKESTDALCNSLKGKEKLLLRQVDFVTAHQKSLLDAQITNVWLTKGSLIGTQEILSKCTTDNTEILKKIEEKLPISLKPVLPIKMITIKLEPKPVSLAIENFAEAHLPATIMHYDSPVIPAKTEDYGDSEQDVLHKSIDRSPSSSTVHINVKFPKLPSGSWLASPPKASTYKPNLANKDNARWLLKSSSEQIISDKTKMDICYSGYQSSLDEESEDSFQMLDMSKLSSPTKGKRNCSTRTSVSSSIEVIQPSDYDKEYIFNGNETSIGRCSLYEPQMMTSNKTWIPTPELCCQANELCGSFADCINDGRCKSLAHERVIQTNKWLEKNSFNNGLAIPANNTLDKIMPNKLKDKSQTNIWLMKTKGTDVQQGQKRKWAVQQDGMVPILKHMENILSSDNKDWLSRSSICYDNTSPISSKIINVNNNYKSWLSPSKETPIDDCSSSLIKILYSPSNSTASWILQSDDLSKKTKYEEDEMKKETKDMKNSSEQQKKGFELSVQELKGAINEIYEKTKCSPGLFKRKENKDFWLSDKENLMERKLKLLSVEQSEDSASLFPSKFVNDNNTDQWLVPK